MRSIATPLLALGAIGAANGINIFDPWPTDADYKPSRPKPVGQSGPIHDTTPESKRAKRRRLARGM